MSELMGFTALALARGATDAEAQQLWKAGVKSFAGRLTTPAELLPFIDETLHRLRAANGAPPVTDPRRSTISDVLAYHHRVNPPSGLCLCGHDVGIGRCFTDHLADMVLFALDRAAAGR